jgi:hypothetical protein
VLRQILEELQALRATVSHLQAGLAELKLLRAARLRDITGRWEGRAQQWLYEGTTLTFPSPSHNEIPQELVIPHDISVFIGIRLSLDLNVTYFVGGHVELEFDFRPEIEFATTVDLPVIARVLEELCITLEIHHPIVLPHWANLSFIPRWGDFSGILSDIWDGRLTLRGTYRLLELAKNQTLTGDFSLQKVSDVESGVRDRDEGAGLGEVRTRERPE